MRLDISESDARDMFVTHLRSEGLNVSNDTLVTDGSRKWVTCLNRNRKENVKSKSGWYRLNFAYDVPSVIYSNYDKGIEKKVWHLDPKQLKKDLSPQEIRNRELKAKQAVILNRRKQRHRMTLQRIAAVWSRIEFRRATPVRSVKEIPYLQTKLLTDLGLTFFNTRKIEKQPIFAKSFHLMIHRATKSAESKGIKVDYEKPKFFKHGWFQNHHLRNTLITPYYDKNLKIVNVQCISSYIDRETGKNKFFKANLSSGQKEGAFCPLNRLPSPDEKFFAISEGYSTGQSFARISKNKPCVMSAFDKNNLLAVSVLLRELNSTANIYLVADNDLKGQIKDGDNGGVTKALEAAKAVDGNVLIPPVKKEEVDYISDWNDLELKYGTEHCFKILSHQLTDISVFKKNQINSSNRPQVSITKSAEVLSPSIFTAWLIEKLDKQQDFNKSQGQSDPNLDKATDIIRTVASNKSNKIVPMMQYICQKNGWKDLNEAIGLLNDKMEAKIKIESETLNRVNFTYQSLFYACNNLDSDLSIDKNASMDKAELQLKHTIEYISYLPVERKEKLALYNNIKEQIHETVSEKEPNWSKSLLKLCINSIDEFEQRGKPKVSQELKSDTVENGYSFSIS